MRERPDLLSALIVCCSALRCAVHGSWVMQYKDKTVVLERERFEAVTGGRTMCYLLDSTYWYSFTRCLRSVFWAGGAELKMKEDELVRVRGDLDSAQEAKRFLEEELASVR